VSLPDPDKAPAWANESVKPTDEQISEWLCATSQANRLWWIARVRKEAEAGHLCWLYDHEHQIEHLRTRAVACAMQHQDGGRF